MSRQGEMEYTWNATFERFSEDKTETGTVMRREVEVKSGKTTTSSSGQDIVSAICLGNLKVGNLIELMVKRTK